MIEVDWSENIFCFLKQSGHGICRHVYHFLPASYYVCNKLRFVGHISIEWEQKKLAWHYSLPFLQIYESVQ